MLIWAERKMKSIGGVRIDVLTSETHDFKSRVPQFPVETGVNVSDHVIQEPIAISLSCVVSDTPLLLPSLPRIKTTYELLRLLWRLREPLTVITALNVYDNMMIENISMPRDRTTGQALNFDVQLSEIVYARSNTILVNPDAVGGDDATKAQVSGSFNAGATSPKGRM